MPGESVDAALDAAHAFGTGGIAAVFTNLGERVTTSAEAVAVRDHYLGVLSSIRRRALSAQISVKLTHLGLDVDQAECGRHVTVLAAHAAETGSFVWIDMEESHYTDVTLDTFRRARRHHANVGVCLQAYLRRTASDLDSLLPLAPAIRLVKGAYSEPAEVAFPSMHDVDESFFQLACRLLGDAATTAVFGTHDMRLVARLREYAAAHDVPESRYEVHMLYGIRSSDQQALANDGCRVRVLISYGTAWFPWYMRRLAERPANVWFVIRNLI